MTIENLIEEFNNVTKMKVFEIEVFDKRTNEKDYVLFDISINEEKNTFEAQHVGLTIEEENSNKIAFKSIDFNDCYSLDEHLQELYSKCQDAIINSDFFQFVD